MERDVGSSSWTALIALGLLAVLGLVAWYAAYSAWSLFRGLEKEVAAALVSGVAAITVAGVTVAGGRYLTRRQELEQKVRESKIPMYEEFVGFWFKMMAGSGTSRAAISEAETLDYMRKFTQSLTVWGSDAVVVEWSQFRRRMASGTINADSPEVLFAFEKLLLAIRREFGHRKRLPKGSLLGLFVNDIDQHL